jgi:hypothetical protein
MADLKISALPASTTPLAGTEVLPVVQSGSTKQVSVANLTAGRTVGTGALNTTGKITVNLDGATGLRLNNTTGGAGQGIEMLTASTKYSFLLGAQYNVNDGFEITPSTVVGGTTFSTPAFKLEYVGSGVFNAAIGTGNLSFANGKGIDFSATPGTGTSELLADYEEGTWTPVYVAATGTLGTVTYENVQGTYVKIGRQVTVTGGFYCSAFAAGTGSGDLRIGGLPFTNSANVNAISVGDSRLFTLNNPTGGQVGSSASTVTLFYRTTANGAINNLQVSDAATGSGALNLVYFTATYQV